MIKRALCFLVKHKNRLNWNSCCAYPRKREGGWRGAKTLGGGIGGETVGGGQSLTLPHLDFWAPRPVFRRSCVPHAMNPIGGYLVASWRCCVTACTENRLEVVMSPKPSLGSAGSQGKGGLTAFKSIGHPAQSAPYCTHSGVLFTTIVNLSCVKMSIQNTWGNDMANLTKHCETHPCIF